LRIGALDVGLGLGVDREGDVLDARRTLGRRHDDLGLILRRGDLVCRRVGGLSRGFLSRLGKGRSRKTERRRTDEQSCRNAHESPLIVVDPTYARNRCH
jgi:hypothetical protein